MRTPNMREDPWPELAETVAELGVDGRRPGLPVALESEVGYLFRDASGRIVHRYRLPGVNGYGAIRHFIRYAAEGYGFLHGDNLKTELVTMIEAALEKLAPVKPVISVFELGSSAGENRLYIDRILRRRGWSNRIRFVGIDNVSSLVTFSRMLQHRNGDSHFIEGDGSDLSRFPDRCFDIVINHGVANYCDRPSLAISEVLRITRHVLCNALHVSLEAEPFHATGAGNLQGYFLPTEGLVEELWRAERPYWVYALRRTRLDDLLTSGGGTGYFIGRPDGGRRLAFDYALVTRAPLFPELASVAREVA